MINPITNSPAKVFATYAIPAVLGMLAFSSVGIIDGLFMSHYIGSSALAVVTVTMPISAAALGITTMLSVGGAVTVGKYIGQNNIERANRLFVDTIAVVIAMALLFVITVFTTLDIALDLMNVTGKLRAHTKEYFATMLLFMPILLCAGALDYFIRIDNRPVFASIGLICGAFFNVAFSWLFIVHLDMGIRGVALGTGVAQIFTLCLFIGYFNTHFSRLKFHKPTMDLRAVAKASVNGISSFVTSMSAATSGLIFNTVMLQKYGGEGIAAATAVSYISLIGLMSNFAISQALQPTISQNIGAKQPQKIKQFMQIAIVSVLALGLVMTILTALIPAHLIDLFIEHDEEKTRDIALHFLSWFWPVFIFNGCNMCFINYLTAAMMPIRSLTLSLLHSLAIPVSLVLLLPEIMPENGIFAVIPGTETLTFIGGLLLFWRHRPLRLTFLDLPKPQTTVQ
ncbi:Multidrug export protein MepA [BD1-7 clade bacterium]|uniref:Multidrug export protein MepA n=1 Tax=BD1-7 clade bacterium TaxID=2029982 RepID=A0A5S9PIX6_9GAMM|nr:Multidrug export protein MepA [BD1-7 clade bacterium]CAA0103798.1 Multidrug export protein MepA [BD1-7 clade bacterium]